MFLLFFFAYLCVFVTDPGVETRSETMIVNRFLKYGLKINDNANQEEAKLWARTESKIKILQKYR